MADCEPPVDADANKFDEVPLAVADGKVGKSAEEVSAVTNITNNDKASSRGLLSLMVLVAEVSAPDYGPPSSCDGKHGDCISDHYEKLIAQH